MEIALSFDDIGIKPRKRVKNPRSISFRTKLTKGIELAIPLVAAGMRKVSNAQLAIALEQLGGAAFIHANQSPEDQAKEIEKIKREEAIFISHPYTLQSDYPLLFAKEAHEKFKVSGFPVVDVAKDFKLVGMITIRDWQWENDFSKKIKDVMTPFEKLVVGKKGISVEEAKELIRKNKIEKLPIIDEKGKLIGLMTAKDVFRESTNALKDKEGKLLGFANINTGKDMIKRADLLVEAGANCLAIEKAHAFGDDVLEAISLLKKRYKNKIEILAGNVVTKEGAKALIDAGADGIKVGMGIGASCETPRVTGVWMPQVSAILNCRSVAHSAGIPLCADGGIRTSGDIVKALVVGASTVMIGALFAGTEESPAELVKKEGRLYKKYEGEGSVEAIKSRFEVGRYFWEEVPPEEVVAEGETGLVPYQGSLSKLVHQLLGGLRSAMIYLGALEIKDLWECEWFVISFAGKEQASTRLEPI